MDLDFLRRLLNRDALLAIGVTLFVLGIILRGFVRDFRRTLARRKQHELDTRRAGTPPVEVPLSHLEKHFAHYANAVFVLGMIVALVALFH